jgi:hypothetical protein
MMFMNIFWILILAGGVILLIKYLSRTKEGDAEFERMKRDLEEVG